MDPPNPSKRPLEDTDNVVESPKRIKEEIENQSEDLGSNDSSSASESSSESEDESSSGSGTSGMYLKIYILKYEYLFNQTKKNGLCIKSVKY